MGDLHRGRGGEGLGSGCHASPPYSCIFTFPSPIFADVSACEGCQSFCFASLNCVPDWSHLTARVSLLMQAMGSAGSQGEAPKVANVLSQCLSPPDPQVSEDISQYNLPVDFGGGVKA